MRARPASMRVMSRACSPNGRKPCPSPASMTASSTASASSRRDADLVAEVTGVAGARDRHRRLGDLGVGVVEVAQLLDARGELREDLPRARSLHGQHAVVVGDVLDRDVEPPGEVAEVADVRLRRGEQELVLRVPEDHAVLEDEPAVVAPDRVLRLARTALPDVARHHAGEQPLGVLAGDPVLVQRRGVEESGAVADREVLVLRRGCSSGWPTGSWTSGPTAAWC